MLKSTILLVLLSLLSPTFAQTVTSPATKRSTRHSKAADVKKAPALPLWEKEPQALFSVRFGQPLTSSLHECRKMKTAYGRQEYDTPLDGPLCYEVIFDFFKIQHVPSFSSVYVEEVDGVVAKVFTVVGHQNLEQSLAALTARFGPPTSDKTEAITAGSGLGTPNHVAEWVGKEITLRFESVSNSMNEGSILASTAAYRDSLQKRSKNQKQLAASAF